VQEDDRRFVVGGVFDRRREKAPEEKLCLTLDAHLGKISPCPQRDATPTIVQNMERPDVTIAERCGQALEGRRLWCGFQ